MQQIFSGICQLMKSDSSSWQSVVETAEIGIVFNSTTGRSTLSIQNQATQQHFASRELIPEIEMVKMSDAFIYLSIPPDMQFGYNFPDPRIASDFEAKINEYKQPHAPVQSRVASQQIAAPTHPAGTEFRGQSAVIEGSDRPPAGLIVLRHELEVLEQKLKKHFDQQIEQMKAQIIRELSTRRS
ncbi:uncharacterized protein MONOS_3384 [Monocercomonoides exilis]|uniref:uncharacterized protein n=1 Tax=Monocercomonoides exilis TaxID=2049356 RepID=UPI003559564A|nr:hypothetical protein MONOS_3384 [Monocercomonoides exilis]|eukprot:MONOS_3384.1-p1 / transcript=MONOS_3384.1 / gene=MONOS_3384 / organism=Monocercomonoides_exilis_PA203 / gene_product=unspecified product / transcript_product=unspecified product / location=Mono_scaffold00079:91711-92329(+) / protein_length=184 / sequence_SO=supercontig / SO=protein_coding / is_pseudo=false